MYFIEKEDKIHECLFSLLEKRLISRYLLFILRSNIHRENKQEESTVHLLFSQFTSMETMKENGLSRKRLWNHRLLIPACNRGGSLHDVYSSHGKQAGTPEFSLFSKRRSRRKPRFEFVYFPRMYRTLFPAISMQQNEWKFGSLISFQEYLELILICRAKRK